MKQLKQNKPLYNYLLETTAKRSARPFESYTKEELQRIFKELVETDWKYLGRL